MQHTQHKPHPRQQPYQRSLQERKVRRGRGERTSTVNSMHLITCTYQNAHYSGTSDIKDPPRKGQPTLRNVPKVAIPIAFLKTLRRGHFLYNGHYGWPSLGGSTIHRSGTSNIKDTLQLQQHHTSTHSSHRTNSTKLILAAILLDSMFSSLLL